jgi:hypothetical protein
MVEVSLVVAMVFSSSVDLAVMVMRTLIPVDCKERLETKSSISICTSSTGIPNSAAMSYLNCKIAAAMSSGLDSAVTSVNVPLICTALAITSVHTSDMFTYPGEHKHCDASSAPASVVVSARHAVHSCDPVPPLYVPGAHATHVEPPGPVCPASHTQSVTKPDTPSVCECTGHRLQFALPSGDHSPAGQNVHVSGPVAL